MGLLDRLFGRAAPAPTPSTDDPDALTIRALQDAGADLARETETIFYLYFPTEGHARSAAHVATREGYAAEVCPPPSGYTTWLCRLTRQMAPSHAAIAATRTRLEELATSLEGEFDGWEAAVAS